ncbi:MAG TPA: phage Gp37/Gp68 family protein [Thermohalobaculum sp.]|nr:phage Gp37/Gp68 family protein [Thermohalobaculum sp.]
MSAIEWTARTWNPLAGCSPVSPGCTNCYAMRMAARLEAMGQAKYAGLTRATRAGPVWTGALRFDEAALARPLEVGKPTTWFVNSMSDLFHDAVPDSWIDRVFAVMALTPRHTYQVLTKRAARMREYLCERWQPAPAQDFEIAGHRIHFPGDGVGETRAHQIRRAAVEIMLDASLDWEALHHTWPLPNVWLGVSVEDQRRTEARIPDLLATPAAVRFVSAEPLLGPVHLGFWLDNLDWVIVGGESGPRARPCRPDWIAGVVAQCRAAQAAGSGEPATGKRQDSAGSGGAATGAETRPAVFVKQLGANIRASDRDAADFAHVIVDAHARDFGFRVKLKHPKGGDPAEWPARLRVRQFPAAARGVHAAAARP